MPDQDTLLQTPFQQHVIAARSAGYSWSDIGKYVTSKYNQALAKGYTDAQIQSYMGFRGPGSATQAVADNSAQTLRGSGMPVLPETASVWDNFKAAVQGSSGGILEAPLLTGKRADAWAMDPHASWLDRGAFLLGGAVGDLPTMIAGGIGGAAAGLETGPGAIVTGGMGAFALPANIKATYLDGLRNGEFKGPGDFAWRQGQIWNETGKQAVVGGLTAAGGAEVEAGYAGAPAVVRAFLKGSAELGVMTTTGALMDGRLPSREEFIDNALLAIAAHGALHVTPQMARRLVPSTVENLQRNWQATGETPKQQIYRAADDEPFRQRLTVPPEAPRWTAPNSYTGHEDGESTTVPRIPGNFESAVAWVLKTEGGYVVDSGGPTKYGISKNAHPGVDIPNLTTAQAVQIYHDDYWEPMHIDSLPDNMKLRVFDASVSAGMGKAKEWLAAAGNDPVKFDELRDNFYKELAERDPAKYGKYLKGWLNRVAQIDKGVPLSDGYELSTKLNGGDEPTSEELKALSLQGDDEQQGFLSRFAASESGAVGGAAKEPLTEENSTALERVLSHYADAEETPGIGERMAKGAYKLYLETLNPDHPLGKLVQAVTEGGSLDDAKNPMFLKRLAETSGATAQMMIGDPKNPAAGHMVNPEGEAIGPSLLAIVDAIEKDDKKRGQPNGFWGYAGARWAADMMRQGKETPIPAADVLQAIQEGHGRYADAFAQLQNWRNQTLDYMRGREGMNEGVLSQAQVDAMKEQHESAMPGYRQVEQLEHIGGRTGEGAPIKRAVGSKLDMLNMKEAILKDTFMRVAVQNHNAFSVAAADAAMSAGLAREERAGPTTFPISHTEAPELTDPDMDHTVAQLTGHALKTDEVPAIRDGVMHKVVYEDAELGNIVRGMNHPALSMWTKMLAKPATMNRAMIALNPEFSAKILGYDAAWQFITKPGFRNTLGMAWTGLGAAFGDHTEGLYDEWARKGAPATIFDGDAKTKYMVKVLKGDADPHLLSGVWNATGGAGLRALRSFAANMSRVMPIGRFAQMGDQSRERAAWEASESPYHRMGAGGPVVQAINAVAPFTTAYAVGLEKSLRSIFGVARPGEEVEGNQQVNGVNFNAKQMRLTWAKAAGIITVPILSTMLMNHDKKWYQAIPDYIKDNCVPFHVGPDWIDTGQKDRFGKEVWQPQGYTFELKFGAPILSTLFGMVPRRLMEQFFYDNPHAWDKSGSGLAAGFLPPGGTIPTFVLPFLEHAANWSFFGQHAIVSDYVRQNHSTEDQYSAYTSSTARALSHFVHGLLGLSPPIIDNYIRDFAPAVAQLDTTIDQGRQALGLSNTRNATPTLADNPAFSSFMYQDDRFNTQPILDFDQRFASYAKRHGDLMQAYQEDDLAKFQQLVAENPSLAAAHHFSARNMPTPAMPQEYANTIRNAQIDPRMMTWLQDAKEIQVHEKFLRYIDELPTRPSPINPGMPYMAGDEKQQMTKQLVGTTMVIAQHANQLADELKIP